MRATLVVRPDGKAILTIPDSLTVSAVESVRKAWEEWRNGDEAAVLIIPDCDVVQVVEFDLDLGDEAAEPCEVHGDRCPGDTTDKPLAKWEASR